MASFFAEERFASGRSCGVPGKNTVHVYSAKRQFTGWDLVLPSDGLKVVIGIQVLALLIRGVVGFLKALCLYIV